MIQRKKKRCRKCGEEVYLYARGMCLQCDRIENPSKHGQIKPSDNTSAKNGNTPSKKKRIAPISAKQAARLKEYRKVRDQYLKANPTCEFPGCCSTAQDLHHGAGKLGGLLIDSRYFKALCREHHRWVEEHPIEAKELGLSFTRLNK